MSTDFHKKFKEKSPEETVEFIKSKLDELKIEVDERWSEVSEIDTYSVRITLKNAPSIGTNGKGTSKAYALASGYAEFMERMQNMRLSPVGQLVNIYMRNDKDCFVYHDEKILSSEELVDENSAYIREFFKQRNLSDASRQEKIAALKKVQTMDYIILKKFDQFICVPFYSVKEGKTQYIPYFLYSPSYASNGMCAGNSFAEALVQGLSEVSERHVHSLVYKYRTALPDIPEEYIKKFPEIYKMYQKIKYNPKFNLLLKDCSYGGKYPALCLVIIDKNTGKYGVKFGAHPVNEIALERLFTEATQGLKLEEFSQKSFLSFDNQYVDIPNNMVNGFRTADAQFPYQMLLDTPSYKFHEFESLNHLDNKDLLRIEAGKLLKTGHDILIYNCSYSGFTSLHVIVPGFSEIGFTDNANLNKLSKRYVIQTAINNPTIIESDLCDLLISQLGDACNCVLENTIKSLSGLYSNFSYIGADQVVDVLYLLAMCYLKRKDYKTASNVMGELCSLTERNYGESKVKYRVIEKYCSGMSHINNHDRVIIYLKNFYDEELCNEIDGLFSDLENVIIKQYPKINADSQYTTDFREFERVIMNYKEYQKHNKVDYEDVKLLFDSIS